MMPASPAEDHDVNDLREEDNWDQFRIVQDDAPRAVVRQQGTILGEQMLNNMPSPTRSEWR